MKYYSLMPHQIVNVRKSLVGEYVDWSIVHMGLDKLAYKGKGQLIGVLDTACDVNHPDLKGRVATENYISGITVPGVGDASHGTFVCSQIVAKSDGNGIVGAAPQANVLHGQVLYGTMADMARKDIDGDIARGITGLVAAGCGVISMSLGGSEYSEPMDNAITFAKNNGVIVVCAAGNEKLLGSPYASYPAACKDAISVAAANKHDLPAWFSTVGVPNTAAERQPEVAIASLEYYWGCLPGGLYGSMIGTSMSAPVLAAVAALWREAVLDLDIRLKGPEVLAAFRKWLRKVSNDTNKNGWDPELGFGTLLLDQNEIDDFGA